MVSFHRRSKRENAACGDRRTPEKQFEDAQSSWSESEAVGGANFRRAVAPACNPQRWSAKNLPL
ncbi:hypothetical protein PC129_g10654 [Phytophthora cactorum]|uniref:Uncharacterized protein n=1 Tax=Phytophthora cactorum TaxID=29920 RepID=A0A8T1GUZ5_9STRA|nr:hypothetical protein Pcac1_g19363 [Phytophthora cactorum]KAG2935804.1 hypothetical protein PC114_g343 [Phytophthora cactorum]KAG2940232.1 hypothetical protein PC117_g10629 [Phytophthora cactorum]KAG2999518.1 hypothetical protein PC118_g760 [Phytophthora cactorum]KAG3016928.1 hypothetical protein PC120_g11340 [Phytophthora cactorum]